MLPKESPDLREHRARSGVLAIQGGGSGIRGRRGLPCVRDGWRSRFDPYWRTQGVDSTATTGDTLDLDAEVLRGTHDHLLLGWFFDPHPIEHRARGARAYGRAEASRCSADIICAGVM